MTALSLHICALLASWGQGALCDARYLDAVAGGDLHHRAFRYEAAASAYALALLEDPAGFQALRGLADVWNDRGEALQGAAAEDAFTKALGYAQCLEDLFPASAEGPAWVAASYGNLTAGAGPGEKVAFAREIAAASRRALALDPGFAPALVALGIYEREMSTLGFFARIAVRTLLGGMEETSLQESERRLRQAVEIAPASVLARFELGLTLLAAKDEAGARAALRAVLDLLPSEAADVRRQVEAARLLARGEP